MASPDFPHEQRGGTEQQEGLRVHPEYQYLDLMARLIDHGVEQVDKGTRVKTYSAFAEKFTFDLSDGSLPLLTTKRVFWHGVKQETYWFLSGQSNVKYLIDNNVPIWNDYPYKIYLEKVRAGKEKNMTKEEFIERIKTDEDFAMVHGELKHIYGESWRRFPAGDGREIDQVAWVLKEMIKDPDAHNLIVDSWRPEFMYGMAKPDEALRFPICHNMYQLNVQNGRVNLQLYQRSADIFLGVPFNIASYALLTHIFAHLTGNKPGVFTHILGDVHIYENHIEQAREQLKREPRPFPSLRIDSAATSLENLRPEHILLGDDYKPHPKISGDLTVAGGVFEEDQ